MWRAVSRAIILLIGLTIAQSGTAQPQQLSDVPADRPVLARIWYNWLPTPRGCYKRDSHGGPGWGHDYPGAIENLMAAFTVFGKSPADSFAALEITDSTLGQYAIAMITEPGCWGPTDPELAALRRYLVDGGLLFLDDFMFFDGTPELFALSIARTEAWLRRVLPTSRITPVAASHPLFTSPFGIDRKTVPSFNPQKPASVVGIYQNNDSTMPLMVVAVYNSALGHLWEKADKFQRDTASATAVAYRFGLNLLTYSLTAEGRHPFHIVRTTHTTCLPTDWRRC